MMEKPTESSRAEAVHFVGRDITRRMQEAAQILLKSVLPIYAPDDKEHLLNRGHEPVAIGSCVILAIADRIFAITAAHVSDIAQDRKLYLGGDRALVEISGDLHFTTHASGERKQDRFDIAFLQISDRILDKLGSAKPIAMSDVDVNDTPCRGHLYFAAGYPSSKNKKKDRARHKMVSYPFLYSSTSRPLAAYGAAGLPHHTHLLIDFQQTRVKNSEGVVVTSPDPHGISGGGAWRIYDYKSSQAQPPKLVGILIEWLPHPIRALVATRMTLVLEAIRNEYPALDTHIPHSTLVAVTPIRGTSVNK